MNKSKKNKFIGSIFFSIFLLCISIFIVYIIYSHFTELIEIRNRTEHLESEILSAINNSSMKLTSKEFEFYRQSTDTAISRIGAVAGMMCAVATLFGLIGILFTVTSYYKEKRLEETVQKRLTEIGGIIEKYQSELNEISIIQHILYADKHRRFEKYNYALNEYYKALEIKNDYIVNYELGTLFADDYGANLDECVFGRAKEYLLSAINICESSETVKTELLSDCYMVLGCIYGTKANKSKKNGKCNAEVLYQDSIDYFNKAIESNKYNLDH